MLACFLASETGLSAALYAVVEQPSGITLGLVAAKPRLANSGVMIPRLELVTGHMVTILLNNVKSALKGLSLRNNHCWFDRTVALHWINGNVECKQLIR